MAPHVTLITGAAGEVGTALVRRLAAQGTTGLITFDLADLDYTVDAAEHHHIQGSVTDGALLQRIFDDYDVRAVYHLAALLSTSAERKPDLAHQVNVDATADLLRLSAAASQAQDRPVQFIFPSSIAVYGIPSAKVKARFARVREWEWTNPTTMYGCNKLYGEMLGAYYTEHFQRLATGPVTRLDFRGVRFPGLISAHTLPSGGTSDYGPEMLHAAAQGQPYSCFVREDSRIPFMAMPDATTALLQLAAAPEANLTRRIYNITSFSPSAGELRDRALAAFPGAGPVTFHPDTNRQAIVDSWPADVDDAAAARDWGWKPQYDLDRAMAEYLLPAIRERYGLT